ncbi:hypothetical protein DL767_004209 [Monosporascus sp. MG133]|nr:hypothetical protein DL767_004209 [Monosporascus sp. MG133]
MTVTLVCIRIPASRALCKRFVGQLVTGELGEYREKTDQVYGLRTIGESNKRRNRLNEGDAGACEPVSHCPDHQIGVGGRYIASPITGSYRTQCYRWSGEEILFEADGEGGNGPSLPVPETGIRITEQFRVKRS